jgi:DNA modification methylase
MIGQDCTDHCYLGHLLQVCDALWRVLRDDSVFVLNLGDSYAGSWGNQGRKDTRGIQRPINGPMMQPVHDDRYPTNGHNTGKVPPGLKNKDLMMLPARVAIALQARGWTLRSEIPWLKRSSMPESVTDRVSVSHETVFLFSKKSHYYYDADSIRIPHTAYALQWQTYIKPHHVDGALQAQHKKKTGMGTGDSGKYTHGLHPNGRNRRTGDWWQESLDALIADTESWLAHAKQVRDHGGMLLSPEGEPLGLKVNPQPYAEAHFATFPETLVEPMIKASTSAYGACVQCGSPWQRLSDVQSSTRASATYAPGHHVNRQYRAGPGSGALSRVSQHTMAWFPGCACGGVRLIHMPRIGPIPTHEAYWQQRQAQIEALWPAVVPCTVLDPLAGRFTTGKVARQLNRRSVGIELSSEYCQLAKDYLHADLPLLQDVPASQNGQNVTQAEMMFDTE